MKLSNHYRFFLILGFLIFVNSAKAQQTEFEPLLFDEGWKFHRGGAQGAEDISFADSAWRTIDIPHDWSIEDVPGTNSPFQRDAESQVNGGFTSGGTGWYRKTFFVPD